ncbi:MAG: hypothetical protein DSY80_09075 [Desulfocapsa sp.]|nr:MAG: hypothetical protein DSY80_09075 [Desulfocapsa sp.]
MKKILGYFTTTKPINEGERKRYGECVPHYSAEPFSLWPNAERMELEILETGDRVEYTYTHGGDLIIKGGKYEYAAGYTKTVTKKYIGTVLVENSSCAFIDTDDGEMFSINPLITPKTKNITIID